MRLKKILDSFPPPAILNIPYAGISISDTMIRCVEFKRTGRGLVVSKYTEKPLADGVVVSGFINNTAELTHVLEGIKKELGLTYVKVSLPEEKAYLFNTKIPVVPRNKVRSSIEYTIEDNVPLPASELVFDYTVVGAQAHEDHLDIVVSAIPSKIIDMYVDVVTSAGLVPLALEIESQAIVRALFSENSEGTYVIADFSKEKVGLYIATNRVVHFTSTINTKGETLDHPSFLSQEIKRLFVYWNTLKENIGKKDREIQQIIFCGEDFPPVLASYISAHNKIPVALGNVWVNAFDVNKIIPPISFTDSLRYASSVGLALPVDILI